MVSSLFTAWCHKTLAFKLADRTDALTLHPHFSERGKKTRSQNQKTEQLLAEGVVTTLAEHLVTSQRAALCAGAEWHRRSKRSCKLEKQRKDSTPSPSPPSPCVQFTGRTEALQREDAGRSQRCIMWHQRVKRVFLLNLPVFA